MENITYKNLFSETRNNVVSLVSNISNVKDPLSTNAEFRKWIYSRSPDVKNSDFKGYPILIVGPARVTPQVEEQSGDMKHKFVDFEIAIEIRTSDRGYGPNNGKGLSYMDSISDDIAKTFNDTTNRANLSKNTLAFCNFSVEDVETITTANELIYRREFIVSFRNRMAISE